LSWEIGICSSCSAKSPPSSRLDEVRRGDGNSGGVVQAMSQQGDLLAAADQVAHCAPSTSFSRKKEFNECQNDTSANIEFKNQLKVKRSTEDWLNDDFMLISKAKERVHHCWNQKQMGFTLVPSNFHTGAKMANGTCMSCCLDLCTGARRGVPISIECCSHCWRKVPVTDRLKLFIAVRDRLPGGVMAETASAASTFIDLKNAAESDD
jgi:hypothetical protein